jgi:hypothetical protein
METRCPQSVAAPRAPLLIDLIDAPNNYLEMNAQLAHRVVRFRRTFSTFAISLPALGRDEALDGNVAIPGLALHVASTKPMRSPYASMTVFFGHMNRENVRAISVLATKPRHHSTFLSSTAISLACAPTSDELISVGTTISHLWDATPPQVASIDTSSPSDRSSRRIYWPNTRLAPDWDTSPLAKSAPNQGRPCTPLQLRRLQRPSLRRRPFRHRPSYRPVFTL